MSDTSRPKPLFVKEQTGGYEASEAFPDTPMIEERYEIIDGVRYDMLPSPVLNHQLLVTQLCNFIDASCHAAGIVIVAPMDVYFDEDNIYQPDVIYVSNENAGILKRKRIEGAPDLVVEILSPSTGEKDKVKKKSNYERFGVPEYWIVDPVHRVVDQYVAVEGKYALYGTYGVSGLLRSPRFACISIRMEELFARLLPEEDE